MQNLMTPGKPFLRENNDSEEEKKDGFNVLKIPWNCQELQSVVINFSANGKVS